MQARIADPHYLVVGTGSIGCRHVANLRRLVPLATITACRLSGPVRSGDVPPAGADHLIGGIAAAVAARPHAAIICSPASHHLDVSLALAQAGVHLLVEKPFAHQSDGVQALVDLSRHRGLVLMVAYCLRFSRSLRALRDALEAGTVGRVLLVRAEIGQYLPDWRKGQDYRDGVSARADLGGGALLELSHEIDYVRWLLGEPDSVTALASRQSDLEMDVEDSADLILTFPAKDGKPGPRASIHLDMLQRVAQRRCRVIGSLGTLEWDALRRSVTLFTPDHPQGLELFPAAQDRQDPDPIGDDMYLAELDHFLTCIAQAQAPLIDGADGLRSLRLVDAAKESVRHGRTIAV